MIVDPERSLSLGSPGAAPLRAPVRRAIGGDTILRGEMMEVMAYMPGRTQEVHSCGVDQRRHELTAWPCGMQCLARKALPDRSTVAVPAESASVGPVSRPPPPLQGESASHSSRLRRKRRVKSAPPMRLWSRSGFLFFASSLAHEGPAGKVLPCVAEEHYHGS